MSANPTPILTGEDKLTSYSNYFLSKDSCKWRSRVGHYRSVTAQDVWPGIDVQYRIAPSGVETVYHLRPGADPSAIQLRYEGQEGTLFLAADGSLQLQTSLGTVKEQAPFAYQNINHAQIEIPCRYELTAEGYLFVLGPYDATREVVIDPLVYCSYWGAGETYVQAMTQDLQHHKLLTGITWGQSRFPITPGAYCDSSNSYAGYVSKLTTGGDSVIFATFLGVGSEQPSSVISDAQGAVYVAGRISGPCGLVPLTPDAFDTTCEGAGEGFFSRFSADGTALEYSSYVGGSNTDFVEKLGMDSLGDVYLWGQTHSSDLLVTPDALYPNYSGPYGDGFLMMFHPATSTLDYSTHFPGELVYPMAIKAAGRGDVWIGGEVAYGGLPVTTDAFQASLHGRSDAFVAHFDMSANRLLYCSYLGGTVGTGAVEEWTSDILPLSGDTVVISGVTMSPDFPVTPDAYDTLWTDYNYKQFVTMLCLPQTLVHSTRLGSPDGGERGYGLAMDLRGSFVVPLITGSPRFPVTADAYDLTFNGGNCDIALCRLSHDLRHLEYATYIGGADTDEQWAFLFERSDAVWLGGRTYSPDFPVTPDAMVSHFTATGFLIRFALPEDTTEAAPPFIPQPSSFSLSAFPNPFNPTTTLTFTLPHPASVRLRLYNIEGQQVLEQDAGRLAAGEQRVNVYGESLASGIYFARLETPGYSATCKLMLLR
ncbi:MAG TPA: T9SS type A sorting domain-containing protein [bacterium]